MGELSKSTIDQKMQQVAQKLVLDLRIEETKGMLQDKVEQVAMVFGEDFVSDLTRLMATVVGIEVLGDPENPLVQACQEQEQAILQHHKLIAEQQRQQKRLLSEVNNMRSCLSSVRKMLKEVPDGLHKEANRLRDKPEPTQLESLLLACEVKFKDILIRTKGVC